MELSRVKGWLGRVAVTFGEVVTTPGPCEKCGADYVFAEAVLIWLRLHQEYAGINSSDAGLSLKFCPSCNFSLANEWQLRKLAPGYQREHRRVRFHMDRARDKGLPATLTTDQWLGILTHYRNMCAYCGSAFTELEHILPLAQGGGTVKDNCVPACRFCNSVKGGRHPDQLIRSLEGIKRVWDGRPEASPVFPKVSGRGADPGSPANTGA